MASLWRVPLVCGKRAGNHEHRQLQFDILIYIIIYIKIWDRYIFLPYVVPYHTYMPQTLSSKIANYQEWYLCPIERLLRIEFSLPLISITSSEEREHMQVSASDHCEKTIPSRVPIFSRGQIDEECLSRIVGSWESLSLADTSDLVSGSFLVAYAAAWRLPGILWLPGFTLPVPVPSKNEHWALNKFCHAGRIKALVLVQCLASLANWWGVRAAIQFISFHINHQFWSERTHACVSQWALWENHPLRSFHPRQRSEECLLWNAERWKSGSFPGTSNLVSGRVLGADAAVWQASTKPLMAINAVDLDMPCFLQSCCPMWQQFANKCNDTVVSRLPSQMSSAVSVTKFFSDWCEGLIHPSSSAKELPVLFASTERLNIFPNSRFITFI